MLLMLYLPILDICVLHAPLAKMKGIILKLVFDTALLLETGLDVGVR